MTNITIFGCMGVTSTPALVLPSKLGQLAQRIERDINSRGLVSGEPYLTANEVGNLMDVHPRTAGRAMQLLASREVLVCKRGSGTFVGPKVRQQPVASPKSIHVMFSHESMCDNAPQDVIAGLVKQMPGCDIQINFLPPQSEDELNYVRQVLQKGISDQSMLGVVLMSCQRQVQELALELGVPTVVYGSDYSTTSSLASVDVDQRETGRLGAQHLITRGHQRIVLMMYETWKPGDHPFFEGIQEVLGDAGLGHDALTLRNLPAEASVVESFLKQLCSAGDLPLGILCRSPFFAAAALRIAELLTLRVPDDVDIVFDATGDISNLRLPHVRPTLGTKAMYEEVGRALNLVVAGEKPKLNHFVIPVQLVDVDTQIYPDDPRDVD